MRRPKVSLYLLAACGLSFLIAVLFYVYIFTFPPINHSAPLPTVISQEDNLINLMAYQDDFFTSGIILFILAFSKSFLVTHKQPVAKVMLVVLTVYFNLLYLWTSHIASDFFAILNEEIFHFVLFTQGSLFLWLGLLYWTVPVDITSLALFFTLFLWLAYTYNIRLSTQICCLVLLPLPTEVYFFDHAEFHLFALSEFATYPFNILTNANVLYLDVALLCATFVYQEFRKSHKTA
jgi:hypothetical protein